MTVQDSQVSLGDIALVIEDPLRDAAVTIPRAIGYDRVRGFIEWEPPMDGTARPSARGLIQKFIDLHGKDDAAIFLFATKFGALGLTTGGLIEGSRGTHSPGGQQDLMEYDHHSGRFRERIAHWRPYIASLRYLVACVTQLRVDPTKAPGEILQAEGFPGSREELWDSFGLGMDYSRADYYFLLAHGPHTVCHNLERFEADDVLKWLSYYIADNWIPLGGLHIGLASDGAAIKTVIRLGGMRPASGSIMEANSLINMLVGQLVALATKPVPSEMVACSKCGSYYEPLRRPKKSEPHYCEPCKAEVAKERKRRWAARNRAAKKASPSTP